MEKKAYLRSINDNLKELNTRQDIISEQRSILVSELAKAIIKEMPNEPIDFLYREFLNACDMRDISDKLAFASALVTHFGDSALSDLLYNTNDDHPTAGTHGKISYVRNRYNDEAFARFSEVIPHAKPIYCQSFEDCSESLASGECEFMMIPLEDSASGRMFGFYSLLDRYEFKIAYVCSIEREDTSNTIRYALASRHLNIDRQEKHKRHVQKTFEFTITHTPSNRLLDLYRAASLSLAKENRTSSLLLPYGENMARFYHSFIITKETRFLPFLLLLSLEYPDYSPIGIYREI